MRGKVLATRKKFYVEVWEKWDGPLAETEMTGLSCLKNVWLWRTDLCEVECSNYLFVVAIPL